MAATLSEALSDAFRGGQLDDDGFLFELEARVPISPADRSLLAHARALLSFPCTLEQFQSALLEAASTEGTVAIDQMLAAVQPQVEQLVGIVDGWDASAMTDAQSAQLARVLQTHVDNATREVAQLMELLHAGDEAGADGGGIAADEAEALLWAQIPPTPPIPHDAPHAFQRANRARIDRLMRERAIRPLPLDGAAAAGGAGAVRIVHAQRSVEFAHPIDVVYVPGEARGDGSVSPFDVSAELARALCRADGHRQLSLSGAFGAHLGTFTAARPPDAPGRRLSRGGGGGARPAAPAAPVIAHHHYLEAAHGARLDELVRATGPLGERSALGRFVRTQLLEVRRPRGRVPRARGRRGARARGVRARPRRAPSCSRSPPRAPLSARAQACADAWTMCTRPLVPAPGGSARVAASHVHLELAAELAPSVLSAGDEGAAGADARPELRLHGVCFGAPAPELREHEMRALAEHAPAELASAHALFGAQLAADAVRVLARATRGEPGAALGDASSGAGAFSPELRALVRTYLGADADAVEASGGDDAAARRALAPGPRRVPSLVELLGHPYFAPLSPPELAHAAAELEQRLAPASSNA